MTDSLPEPYPRIRGGKPCPFSLRCDEIDAAALLIRDPDAFAEAARGDRVLSPAADFRSEEHGFFMRPNGPFIARFTQEGGCPAFKGSLNGGSVSTVLCALTDVQLHIYCEEKFCKKGRKVYCPIWKAKGALFAKNETETDD